MDCVWIECGFILKRVRDMARTYSQMLRTDKYSEHSSIIWPVWSNCWVFVYELSGSGLESSSSHFSFRFRACFEQGVPYIQTTIECGLWIHSETCTWHDKNIQSRFNKTYDFPFRTKFQVTRICSTLPVLICRDYIHQFSAIFTLFLLVLAKLIQWNTL